MAHDIKLSENDINGFQRPMEVEMEKAIKHLESELVKIRTGRAHTSLVENIQVDAYGQMLPLKGVGVISAPEARLITIQPWDATVINEIEKAILASDLGVTPVNDGKIIRIQLSEMSTDRRDELLKILGKKLEECKIAIRNVRKDFHNLLRDGKKKKAISENFHERLSDILAKVTTQFTGQADTMAEKKKKEVSTL